MASDARQTRRAGFRAKTFYARGPTWKANGTLDSNEISHESVVTFDEQLCQVSSKSNEPFRNGVRCAPNPTRGISGQDFLRARSDLADERLVRFE
jgi:hypothetical protein